MSRHTIAYVLLAAGIVLGLAALGRHQQEQDRFTRELAALVAQNATAIQALCAQRVDLDKRIGATGRLLREHPRGPIFGLPRKLILDADRRNREFRANLTILDCRR